MTSQVTVTTRTAAEAPSAPTRHGLSHRNYLALPVVRYRGEQIVQEVGRRSGIWLPIQAGQGSYRQGQGGFGGYALRLVQAQAVQRVHPHSGHHCGHGQPRRVVEAQVRPRPQPHPLGLPRTRMWRGGQGHGWSVTVSASSSEHIPRAARLRPPVGCEAPCTRASTASA
eukprot:scaffold6711_cov118-Isochrysis_galbana.AAC.30